MQRQNKQLRAFQFLASQTVQFWDCVSVLKQSVDPGNNNALV